MLGRGLKLALWAASLAFLVATPTAAFADDPVIVIPTEVRPPGDTTNLGNDLLSDEKQVSRWAYADRSVQIRTEPSDKAHKFGRLRYLTEDGVAEIYLVLASQLDKKGKLWVKIRIPGRPNGQTGWVRRIRLGKFHVVTTYLRVEKKRFRATLFKDGREIWSSRIGHGAIGTATPSGNFYVRELMRNLDRNPVYGPFAFGTSAYSVLSDWPGGGVVGIHGTNQPGLLPGRVSHGCIRLPNDKIKKLAKLMPVGTPVHIY